MPPPKTNQQINPNTSNFAFLDFEDPNPVSTVSTVTPPPPKGFQGASRTAGRTRQIPRIWHEHHRPSCPLWNLDPPKKGAMEVDAVRISGVWQLPSGLENWAVSLKLTKT